MKEDKLSKKKHSKVHFKHHQKAHEAQQLEQKKGEGEAGKEHGHGKEGWGKSCERCK